MGDQTVDDPAVLEAAFGQANIGVAVFDRDLRFVRVNAAMFALDGVKESPRAGLTVHDVLKPQAAIRTEGLLKRALAGEATMGLDIEGGSDVSPRRRFRVSYMPIRVGDDAISGVVALLVETTDEAAQARADAAQLHERLAIALEGSNAGIFDWRSEDDSVVWSDGLAPLFGLPRGWQPTEDYQASMKEYVHPEDFAEMDEGIWAAAQTGTEFEGEFRAVWPDGRVRWLHCRVTFLRERGEVVGSIGLVTDIHGRKVREQGAEFLARASDALAHSLEVDETLRVLADLATDEMADWCQLWLVDPAGGAVHATVAHPDPAMLETLYALHERYTTAEEPGRLVSEVIARREPTILKVATEQDIAAVAVDEATRKLVRQLAPYVAALIPMVARGRVVGAVVLGREGGNLRFGEARLEVAEEFARRGALAVDNALLMRAEREANMRLRHLQVVTDAALDNLDLDFSGAAGAGA